jgi:hypothetical protein
MTSSQEKLESCPHCAAAADGGTVHIVDVGAAQVHVLCDFRLGGCGASGGVRETHVQAAAAWNRRS